MKYEDQLAAARYRAERDQARQELARLRDEMEAMRPRLMPEGMEWPRYESGELVGFGDEASRLGEDFKTHVVCLYSDGSYALNFNVYLKGESVKRPAPKVLDADGAEIRVGDVLYRKSDGHMVKVAEVYEKTFTDADDYVRPGDGFTHRAPVLAADGEPLEVGQTVWRDDGEMLEVLYLRPDGLVDCCGEIERSERLTHHRPVLDAEGNRIEPAMDVWWVCEGDERGVHAERLRVETIGMNGLVECSPYNGGTWVYLEPSELYVNEPVIAADGRPLREGETVWYVPTPNEAKECKVEELPERENGERAVCLRALDGTIISCPTRYVTHERHDSWERWRDEWQWPPVKYCELILGVEYDHDAQLQESFDAQGDDLVRRAKKLAGVGE